jgi:GntR family transcriptional regulator
VAGQHSALQAALKQLRGLVGSQYAPGEKLPSEQQLALDLQVSRPTVREALGALASEGLVERRWGSGTFVAPPPDSPRLSMATIQSYRDRIVAGGHQVELAEASAVRRTVTPAAAGALGLSGDTEVWHVERLFVVDKQPTALMHEDIPLHIRGVEFDARLMLDIESSLYDALDRHVPGIVAHTETDFEAVSLGRTHAPRLGLTAGRPVLRATQVTMSDRDEPLVHGVTLHRTDVVRLRIIR